MAMGKPPLLVPENPDLYREFLDGEGPNAFVETVIEEPAATMCCYNGYPRKPCNMPIPRVRQRWEICDTGAVWRIHKDWEYFCRKCEWQRWRRNNRDNHKTGYIGGIRGDSSDYFCADWVISSDYKERQYAPPGYTSDSESEPESVTDAYE